jgi:amino acid permease
MDISSIILVSVLLLLVVAGLIISHVRAWRDFQQANLDAEEFDYRRRQFRRRMQTSAMLGVVAAGLLIGYLLTVWLCSDWFTVIFWTAMMGLACWIVLLAIVDVWATKHHFNRMRHHCLVEQAKLQAELHRMQAYQGNEKRQERGG